MSLPKTPWQIKTPAGCFEAEVLSAPDEHGTQDILYSGSLERAKYIVNLPNAAGLLQDFIEIMTSGDDYTPDMERLRALVDDAQALLAAMGVDK